MLDGWGDLGRNTVSGPGISTFDFSLFKNTALAEEVTLQFRAEFFNIFNRTNFGRIENRIFSSARTSEVDCSVYGAAPGPGCDMIDLNLDGSQDVSYRSDAGRILNTRTSSRQIQLGLRLIF